MRDQSLRTHLANLEQQGELVRFTAEIDPDRNMSAVAHRTFAELGKACLFENVKGHPGWRVAAQLVSDRRKWAVALGVGETEVVATLIERIAARVATATVAREDAPVKEVILLGDEVDLGQLPAMWTSEKDPGRYIAAGMCFIKDPETGIRNVSFHRAQIIGPDRTGFLICPRQALKIFELYGRQNRPMEVAMVVGAHPLIAFAAGFVADYGTDEMTIAGALLGDPVRMVKCETIDMEVPAEAELVIEGEIFPGERTPEGPFGEVTGTYAQEGATPLFRVKAVTHRKDPIFHAMQCGLAPSEAHALIGTTVEMKLWEHLSGIDAGELELLDVRCIGGMSPLFVVLQVKQELPGQARTAALAALSSPYLHPKFAIAVDDDIDPSDVNQVMWALATRLEASRDVARINTARVFTLDNASPIEPGMSPMYRVGTKMLLDATRPPGDPRFARAERWEVAAAPGETRAAWARDLRVRESEILAFIGRALAPQAARTEAAGTVARREVSRDLLPNGEFAAVAVAREKASGRETLGLARLAPADGRFAIVELAPALERLMRQGEELPLALLPRAAPALLLAAALGTWRPSDLALAARLGGRPLALVRDAATGLVVPADAFAIFGAVRPGATARTRETATPFGTRARNIDCALFEPRAIADHAEAAQLAAHALRGARTLAAEALVLNHIRNIEGGLDVIDVRCPAAASAQIVVLKMRARVEGQAKTALMGALSGPVNWAKLAIAVDEDVDAADPRDVFWSIASRTHAEKDVAVIPAMRAHPLDYSAIAEGGGRVAARWLIDSTMPPLTQGKRRDDFARAIPKNLAATDLSHFLPVR
jgi:2,5-furandicarboxylate decarboxylase 1